MRGSAGFGGTFAVKNEDTSIAMLSDKMRRCFWAPAPRSHRIGQLMPDAYRRRAAPGAAERRAHRSPCRNSGIHGGGPSMASAAVTAHISGTGEARRCGYPAPAQYRQRHADHPRQARLRGRRGAGLGGTARGRAVAEGAYAAQSGPLIWSSLKRPCRRRAGRSIGRVTGRKPAGSSSKSPSAIRYKR